MIKHRKPLRRDPDPLVTVRDADARTLKSKVVFGAVTVRGEKPKAAVVHRNVERSSEALERLGKRLIKPGIFIRRKKGVPEYSVAEGEVGVFIRKLNGNKVRGRVVDGVFQVID